jgi:(p)ppGpp synthase/HD superfamily hydrolase
MSRVHLALRRAVELHDGQSRRGEAALPYACHPVEVAALLRWEAGVVDEDDICAALLHDVLEETAAKPDEIEAEFGPTVAQIIVELTREEPSPDQTKGLSKDEIYSLRSGLLLSGIRAMSPRAQRIKLCDRLSNLLEAQRTRTTAKYQRYLRQSLLILEIIPRSVCPPVWDKIQTVVKDSS